MNLEKLVSNKDIEKFVSNLNLSDNPIFFLDKVTDMSQIFPGNNNFAFLFKQNPIDLVGHWILMINIDDIQYEYFDPLGHEPPSNIITAIKLMNFELIYNAEPLQHKNSLLCGKWCIARFMSRDISLKKFINILKTNYKYSPDEIIDTLYRLPY